MFLRIALPFLGLWEDGWAFLRVRGAAGTTAFPPQVILSGIQVLLIKREIKMLVTLREDPVPFFEVLLHSHLASRTCAWEWLQLSCSLSGFHCVLVKDTSDQTRLLRYRGRDRPLTSISKRLPSKGLTRMPTSVAWISPLSPLLGVTGPETSLYSKDHGHSSTEAEHCLWTLYKPMTKIRLSS